MSLNFSTYIFGHLAEGYTQYPSDETTQRVFSFAEKLVNAPSQLILHRQGPLIYYSYIRRLTQNRFIGLSVVFNGVYSADLAKVFEHFEQTVHYCVSNGYLVKFNENADIVPNATKIYLSADECDSIHDFLSTKFSSLFPVAPLPPLDYSVQSEDVKTYVFSSLGNVGQMMTRPNVVIYKSNGYDTAMTNSYRGVISRLKNEKDNLLNEKIQIEKKLNASERKRKHTYWIWGFSILALLFLTYLWNNVWFPSTVTNKDMGEYNYYGEMRNGLPDGRGVAFFKDNDKDERAYYVGKFVLGKRHDSDGIMCFKNGDVFKGRLYDTHFNEGVLLKPSDNSYYRGSWKEDEPDNGKWYDLEERYEVVDGVTKEII